MYTEMKALQSTILSGNIGNEKQHVTVCIKNIHIFIILWKDMPEAAITLAFRKRFCIVKRQIGKNFSLSTIL